MQAAESSVQLGVIRSQRWPDQSSLFTGRTLPVIVNAVTAATSTNSQSIHATLLIAAAAAAAGGAGGGGAGGGGGCSVASPNSHQLHHCQQYSAQVSRETILHHT